MRNSYSPEFKAKAVREVLREDKTLSQVAERDLLIKRRIDEVYTAAPFYGIRKITAQLRQDGLVSSITRQSPGTCVRWACGRSIQVRI